MDLVGWLNRSFRTSFLSAPLAAMAGGAEGVSVVHPIEADGATSEERAAAPETSPSEDAADASETKPDPPHSMADDIKELFATYSAQDSSDPEADGSAHDAEDTPIIRLANTILQQAIKERASDIHIEPGVKSIRVRYHIDGVLHEAMPMPKYLESPLIHRYKVLAGIDIATHRGQPQEGRIAIRYEGDYDLRVNTHPTQSGDHLAFHINSLPFVEQGLDKLGFVPEMQTQLENLVNRPSGLLLIAGPAGAGKTTTQYSLLNGFRPYGTHIATVEQRPTHRLPGVTQIVVDSLGGGTLASTMATALLQDVDVLGISDIRDRSTAQAALDAAAGVNVVATIHGDRTLSTLVQLLGMGFDPGLLTEAVSGVVAQRLVRRICIHCKETYEVESQELRRFGLEAENSEAKVTLARGVGCDLCRRTGYRGRIGLYEVFEWDPTLTQMFADRAPLPHLKQAAFRNDHRHDLRADGLVKILAHLTTPQEVYRLL